MEPLLQTRPGPDLTQETDFTVPIQIHVVAFMFCLFVCFLSLLKSKEKKIFKKCWRAV